MTFDDKARTETGSCEDSLFPDTGNYNELANTDEIQEYGALSAAMPDVRDGLNAHQRVVMSCLEAIQAERPGRSVPTVMLYGRVLEHINISEAQLQQLLASLGVSSAATC